MATWIGSARTNYFRVKDGEALRAWAEAKGLAVLDRMSDDRVRRYGVFASEGWPQTVPTDDKEGWRDFDLVTELSEHVTPGDVVIAIEAGAESLRFITGDAIAFRVLFGKVERLSIRLEDIYELVEAHWGAEPGRAEY